MKTQYTPGPWKTTGKWWKLKDKNHWSGGFIVCKIVTSDGTNLIANAYASETENEAIANARLIASAPELLEACKVALDNIGTQSDGSKCFSIKDDKIYEILKSAIAKAEGGN